MANTFSDNRCCMCISHEASPNTYCCYTKTLFCSKQILAAEFTGIILLSARIRKYPRYGVCVWKAGGASQWTAFFITIIKYSIEGSPRFSFTTEGVTYQNWQMWLLGEPLPVLAQKRKTRHANMPFPSSESSASRLKSLWEIKAIM